MVILDATTFLKLLIGQPKVNKVKIFLPF